MAENSARVLNCKHAAQPRVFTTLDWRAMHKACYAILGGSSLLLKGGQKCASPRVKYIKSIQLASLTGAFSWLDFQNLRGLCAKRTDS